MRKIGLILSVMFMVASVLACGVLPDSPAFIALLQGDTSAFCAPFKITSITGLPLGPARITFEPILPATDSTEGATEYTFMNGYGDTATAPRDANYVDMKISSKMAQYDIDHGRTISFMAAALTNSQAHPLCSAYKDITFTKSEKKAKLVQSTTPQPTTPATPIGQADDRCKAFQFISVTPYGPARISWSPFQHGYLSDESPYVYWYNVVISATATDHTAIPLVDEWVKEPGVLPQAQIVNASFGYKLPGTKRIYSYTVQVMGGYASADYPDHIADGKGYIEPNCSISRTLLVTLTPTPMPPTATPIPTQAPQQPQPHSQPQAPKPPKAKSCPPGTTGDPSKGIPCVAVPK